MGAKKLNTGRMGGVKAPTAPGGGVAAPTYGSMQGTQAVNLDAPEVNYGTNAGNPTVAVTYGEYLQNAGGTVQSNYDTTIGAIDQQNKETLAALDAQKTADLGYNQTVHDTVKGALAVDKTLGEKQAKDQYDLAINYAEGQKATSYEAAEAKREEEYRLAEIERERGVVDARTSYAQNMAGYGANAEQMGRMGLAGSGHSDYVNAQAYATQRAETQAANAKSEKAKREARYAESEAKTSADLAYGENQYKASSKYSSDLYDVGVTYNQGLRDADLAKIDADYGADKTHRTGTLEANNKASDARAEAETTYREGMLALEGDKAKYTEDRLKTYTEILADATAGVYTAEQVEELARLYGFSEEEKAKLVEAAGNSMGSTMYTEEEKKALEDKILTGAASLNDVTTALSNGYITQEDYNDYVETLKNAPDFARGADGDAVEIKFNNDGKFLSSFTPGARGNNFSVSDGETIYRVQYVGGEAPEEAKNAGKHVNNDTVFGYKGKIYIKKNDKVYEIEARGNKAFYGDSSKEGYRALWSKIYPTGYTE